MSVELIYKTTSQQALDWWAKITVERERVYALRREYETQALEEFGPVGKRYSYSEDEPSRRLVVGRYHASGLDCRHDEQPPADSGWRLDSKTGWWYPKLATAKGKARRAELSKLTMPKLEDLSHEVGVDGVHWGSGYMYWPGFILREDTGELWVYWGAYECSAAMAKFQVDGITWTEVPRSEWYAWREQAEAESK